MQLRLIGRPAELAPLIAALERVGVKGRGRPLDDPSLVRWYAAVDEVRLAALLEALRGAHTAADEVLEQRPADDVRELVAALVTSLELVRRTADVLELGLRAAPDSEQIPPLSTPRRRRR